MIDFIKSNDLKKYISMKLNKSVLEITSDDIQKIVDISFNSTGLAGNETDYIFDDLIYFNNLSRFSLTNYEITEDKIKILNQLSNLKFLQFEDCSFFMCESNLKSVENLHFNKCTNVPIENIDFSNVKTFSFNSFLDEKSYIDISNFNCISRFENVSLNNCLIDNIELFLTNENIKSINLDASSNYSDNFVEKLKDRDVKISTKSFYILS